MRKFKRTFMAFLFIFVLILNLIGPVKANAKGLREERLAGENRYETAIEISKKAFSSNENIILANGEGFADSLSGNQLAIALKAPILLTKNDRLPPGIMEEIRRLQGKNIYILGGDKAISREIEIELAKNYRVKRLGGKSRYETSKIIFDETSKLGKYEEIVLVSGENYPDALSATTYLIKNKALLLLTRDEVPKTDKKVLAIGGDRALPLKNFSGRRLGGKNRYETALKVSEEAFPKADAAILASGENFPDALSAVSLANKFQAPVLLSEKDGLISSAKAYLDDLECEKIYIVGGDRVLSNEILKNKNERKDYFKGKKTPRGEDIGEVYSYQPKEEEVSKGKNDIEFVNNEVLITFEKSATEKEIDDLIRSFGFKVVGKIDLTKDYQLKLDKKYGEDELDKLIEDLKGNRIVNDATKNIRLDLRPDSLEYKKSEKWANKWLGDKKENSKDNWGVKAIGAEEAWKYSDEMEYVNVGVIDTIFETSHEDIMVDRNNVWYNIEPKIAKSDKNYMKNSSESDLYHGTHVTGTIGANFYNDKGIVGVAPKTRPYLVSVYGTNESSSFTTDLKLCLTSLITSDCKVINISMGYGGKDKSSAGIGGSQMGPFLKEFIYQGYEFVIVQSAGNESSDTRESAIFANIDPKYKEVRDRIIIVGSAELSGRNPIEKENGKLSYELRVSDFSNYGEEVDILAPGKEIMSTFPENTYKNLSGTSMAAPHVSGVCAMCFSINPSLSGARVKNIVIENGNNDYNLTIKRSNNSNQVEARPFLDAKSAVEEARNKKDEGEWKNAYEEFLSGRPFTIEKDEKGIDIISFGAKDGRSMTDLAQYKSFRFALIRDRSFKNPLLLIEKNGLIAPLHYDGNLYYCGGLFTAGMAASNPEPYFNKNLRTLNLKCDIYDPRKVDHKKESTYLEIGPNKAQPASPLIVYGYQENKKGPIVQYQRITLPESYEKRSTDMVTNKDGSFLILLSYFDNRAREISKGEFRDFEKNLVPITFTDYSEANFKEAVKNLDSF